ncbi:TetR/AcrR family transcriptional regulator [Aeromicrobium sp. A1-2]|nr:TetR/AcrR family transcriptional regulator [Aeromicrobium sp. A1-2]
MSLDDWTIRALDLLKAEGVGALKISRLCSELGVTKGSFYWHFADVEGLKEAVAERWCSQTREALGQLSVLDDLPPLERLRIMSLRLVDDDSWSVERALRDWARSDPLVAGVIAESDQFVFELVQGAIAELGHDAASARMRAGLLVYAGIGFAHGQSALPKPTADDIEDLLDFLAGERGADR